MPRTTRTVSTPSFIADPGSVTRSTGRQVDWSAVASSFANAAGKKVIPAGHRVYTIDASGKLAVAAATGRTLFGVLATDAIEGDPSAALSGYGVIRGGILYAELMPETLDETAQTALKALGTGFAFESYNDTRAS